MKVIHSLPGRVRIEIPQIYLKPALATGLIEHMQIFPGVKRVEANTFSARVLVLYEPRELSNSQLQNSLRQTLGLLSRTRQRTSRKNGNPPLHLYELEKLPIRRQALLTGVSGALLLYASAVGNSRSTLNLPPIRNFNTAVGLVTGIPIFHSALDHLLKGRRLSTELLATIASFTSLAAEESRMGLFINLLVYLSTLLRTLAAEYARDRIRVMLRGRNTVARLKTKQGLIKIPAHSVPRGEVVIVRGGERVPVDGKVLNGWGQIAQQPFRGKFTPETVQTGTFIYAGSILGQGKIEVKADRVGEETYIGKIIQMHESCSQQPPWANKKVARISNGISLLAIGTAAGIYTATGDSRRALSALIVGAPGAAGMSSSMAYGAAVGKAASRGILVKDGRHMETAGRADIFLYKQREFKRLTPKGKAQLICGLQEKGYIVACVGDKVNDVQALSTANVGITKMTGDELNLESANIVLTSEDPRLLDLLRILARDSVKVARQNTFLSLGVNLAGLSLGIGNLLTPLLMGILQNVSTLGILLNSGRILLPKSFELKEGVPYEKRYNLNPLG